MFLVPAVPMIATCHQLNSLLVLGERVLLGFRPKLSSAFDRWHILLWGFCPNPQCPGQANSNDTSYSPNELKTPEKQRGTHIQTHKTEI